MEKFLKAVEKNGALAKEALDYLWKNPETGYKEWKAHAYLAEKFRTLGYELVEAGNIPGFYTDLDTGRPGPTVLVMGELDALICESHPDADPETGAVHSCGHCCQAAGLLGVAAALKEPGVLDGWCGKIRLMATPAEELIEVEYREQLRKAGTVKYYGGKVEFMHRGFMDGVDVAFMIHSSEGAGIHGGTITKGSNGCITKTVTFHGKSAHAGGSPHNGINALYAATQAMNAVNALRETFQDSNHIRFHPILTNGGTVVNAIPETVTMETYVRGASMPAIAEMNRKINRALAASAASIGARITITDRPGYSPRIHDDEMMLVAKEAMEACLEKVKFNPAGWGSGCSDLGDVSMVIPAVHPYVGGVKGTGHGNNYFIADPETACVDMAKVEVLMLELLLKDGAKRAKSIKENFVPTFATMEEYFACIDSMDMDKDAVIYNEDGTVTLDFAK